MSLARWLFSFWLVITTIRYCGTIVRSLQSPFNEGFNSFWTVAWLATIAMLILSYVLFQTIRTAIVWMALFAAVALSILVLSRTFVPFVLACWILCITAGLGLRLLQRLMHSDEFSLERFVCAIPLGFGLLSLAMFVLGVLQILWPVSVWSLLIVATIPVAMSMKPPSLRGAFLTENITERGILLGVMGIVTLLNLLWAAAPEVQYDALNYHLAVPKAYVQHGGFVEIPFLHAYLVRLIEYVVTLCLAVGGAETAKLWMFLMGGCATLSVFALGKLLFNERVALWAAAFFHTTPLVSWLTGTAYIDLIIAYLVTATLVAFAAWNTTRNSGWYYVACLLGGVALGSKLNAAFAFVVPGIASVRKSRMFVVGLCAFILIALPSYVLVYWVTGNPIFPLLNGVFHSAKWEPENPMFNSEDFGLEKSLPNLARLPFRITFDSSRFGEALPRGALGISLLLAFPFSGLLIARDRKVLTLLIGTAVVYLLCFFYTMQYGRYYIVILPVIAVLGVASAFHFEKGSAVRWSSICLWIGLLAQPLATPLQFWNIPERFPFAVAFGSESRETFLNRAVPGHTSAMFLNRVVTPNETILGVGTENLRFYLSANLETYNVSLGHTGARQIADLQPNGELAAEMKRLGYKRMFLGREALKGPLQKYPYLKPEFLSVFTILEFEDEHTVVYRLASIASTGI